MQRKDGYYTNQHSCFLLQYQLILVTKYKQPTITGELEKILINYIKEYFSSYGLEILEIITNDNYIHIIFDSMPNINLSNFINGLKSGSSRHVKTRYQNFIGPFYWKSSYFLGTTNAKINEIITEYVKEQLEEI